MFFYVVDDEKRNRWKKDINALEEYITVLWQLEIQFLYHG